MLTLSLPRDLPAHPGDPVVFEPAQLVDVPLVEAVDGDVAEERVAGALRERVARRAVEANVIQSRFQFA